MRIIVLTSTKYGIASMVLPELCLNPQLDVVKVVFARKNSSNQIKKLKRKVLKISRIGLLGALNGIRLRKWYSYGNLKDIYTICEKNNVQFSETDYLNHSKTIDIFKEAKADIGVSLGNGYITKSLFSIPKFGMINIHTELLPAFRGGAEIIWPIYERVYETGFTIHQISSKFDKGDILYQKKFPIKFYPTLKKTVLNNQKNILPQIPQAISYVCENYINLKSKSTSQGKGKLYTTPTFSQYKRMLKNNDLMYKESLLNK